MKSTNSAFSDYNFLFENIDQTMNMNTQLLVEELLQQTGHRATVSMNEVLPATRLPEVEEVISIEDTYRETAAALNADFNESSSLLPGDNKSMTIIQEDEGEYEDSQYLQRFPKAPQLSHREKTRDVLLQPRDSYETFGKLKGDTFRYSADEPSEDS